MTIQLRLVPGSPGDKLLADFYAVKYDGPFELKSVNDDYIFIPSVRVVARVCRAAYNLYVLKDSADVL